MIIKNKHLERQTLELEAEKHGLKLKWVSSKDCLLTSSFGYVYGEAYGLTENKVDLYSSHDRYVKVQIFGEFLEKELNREVELVID